MANKYFTRRFTVREIVLLITLFVVIIVGLYFALVFYPIQSRTEELQTQRDELQLKRQIADLRKVTYDDMKSALDKINQDGGSVTEMPLYNNNGQQEVLAACFSTIFAGMNATISYSTPSLSDGIYSRSVQFSFEINDENRGDQTAYEKTVSVLNNLLHTGFRCLMTSLNLAPSGGDLVNNNVSVSTTIVFYERA